jgi:hypothetical protein
MHESVRMADPRRADATSVLRDQTQTQDSVINMSTQNSETDKRKAGN